MANKSTRKSKKNTKSKSTLKCKCASRKKLVWGSGWNAYLNEYKKDYTNGYLLEHPKASGQKLEKAVMKLLERDYPNSLFHPSAKRK
jgi:hypothetical protein